MQFNVDSKALKDALSLIAGIPGYTDRTVLLTALKTAGELRIECAAAGSYIKLEIDAKVVEGGKCSIDSDYIAGLHLATVATFNLQGTTMYVTSSKWSYELGVSQIDKVKNNRPNGNIECTVSLSKKMLTEALNKSSIVPAIPNPNHGVQLIVEKDMFKVCCNDQFRGTIYRAKLPMTQPSFNVVFKLPVLNSVINRIPDSNITMGEDAGMLRILSGTVEFYYPTLQVQADDVEGFFDSLDYNEASTIELNADSFVADVQAASSIISNLGYEAKLDLAFDKTNIDITVSSPHGEAKAEHTLAAPVDEKFSVTLSNKYLQEMLALLNETTAKISIWEDRIVLSSTDDTYKSAMPTISEE